MKKQRFFSVPTAFTITYLGNGTTPFTPEFKTSVSTTIRWKPDDAPETVTGPGTDHNFSYVPSPGRHRCTVRVTGGYGLVSYVRFYQDNVLYAPLYLLSSTSTLYTQDESQFIYNIRNLPPKLVVFVCKGSYRCFGSLADLSRSLSTCYISYNSIITGALADAYFINSQFTIVSVPKISGFISDLNPNLIFICLSNNSQLTIGDVSKYTKIQDLQLYNMSWSQAQVDQVIDYIYQAVVADPDHFTYSNPKLNISGNNAAPSGTYQYSASPATGLEKVYYLCHLAAHHWTITWTGGSGP